MTLKRLATLMGMLALIAIIAALAVSTAFAQTATPQAPDEQQAPLGHFGKFGFGFGMGGIGSTATFDAVAEALELTPTALFEQLHSGKSLNEIAQAQGVEMQAIQDAVKNAQIQATRDRINQAVADGRMSQEQADWLLRGLEQGYLGRGRGFNFGHGMRDNMLDGMRGRMPKSAPATPKATGTAG